MNHAEMIELLATEITDRRVLGALAAVPRELFVPESQRKHAWENRPLPIGAGQTISQPLIVGNMCELLELTGQERVLDVGGGSGYHAAVLGELAARVYSVERQEELVGRARQALTKSGSSNVEMIHGDGSRGLPEKAPFDAINVAAAVQGEVPPALREQLAEGGRMVVPVGHRQQWLELWRRTGGELERQRVVPVAFVPLIEARD